MINFLLGTLGHVCMYDTLRLLGNVSFLFYLFYFLLLEATTLLLYFIARVRVEAGREGGKASRKRVYTYSLHVSL